MTERGGPEFGRRVFSLSSATTMSQRKVHEERNFFVFFHQCTFGTLSALGIESPLLGLNFPLAFTGPTRHSYYIILAYLLGVICSISAVHCVVIRSCKVTEAVPGNPLDSCRRDSKQVGNENVLPTSRVLPAHRKSVVD